METGINGLVWNSSSSFSASDMKVSPDETKLTCTSAMLLQLMQPGLEPGTVRNITIPLPSQEKNSPRLIAHQLSMELRPAGWAQPWSFRCTRRNRGMAVFLRSLFFLWAQLWSRCWHHSSPPLSLLQAFSWSLNRNLQFIQALSFFFFFIISRIKNRDFPSETQASHKEEIKKIWNGQKKKKKLSWLFAFSFDRFQGCCWYTGSKHLVSGFAG